MKSKLEMINKAAKTQLTEMLSAMSRAGNADMARRIDAMRFELNRQSDVGSMDVVNIDARIFKYVRELESDIVQGSYRVAEIRLGKLTEIIAKRAALCSTMSGTDLMTKAEQNARKKAIKLLEKSAAKNGFDLNAVSVPVGELYTDSDVYDIMIAQLQDDNERIERELAEMKERQYANPNDAFLQSQITNLQVKLSGMQQKMRIMCDESNRSVYISAMQSVTDADKLAIANRRMSEEQFKTVQTNYAETMQRRNAETQGVMGDIGRFIENGSNAAIGASAEIYDGATSSAIFQSGNVASEKSCAKLYADINPIVRALERSRGIYASKLDELDKKSQSIAKELRSMLAKRKDMSAEDRLVFDGKIDSLRSERLSVMTAIEKYRQVQAINDDKMKLAKDLQQQMEINKVEAETSRLAGSLVQDWEQIAMELNKYVRSGNAELERMADANAVASSEEIEFRSATGTRGANAKIIENDDDKYAELERELGMSD